MRNLFILFLFFAFISCSDSAQLSEEKTGREILLERLSLLKQKGYMFGHQDDTFYGLNWEWELDRSDILETVGDYPAIMGFDLGGIEMDDDKNLDDVPFERIREELIKHHERGGIVTISWHPRNPVTGGTAWDVSDHSVINKILNNESIKEKFLDWIKKVGDFLETLKSKNGKKIPIIFRPWHENNGSWFWWGQNLCSDEEYRAFWNLLQDALLERGFDNLLWSYSPNLDGSWNESKYLKRYPGNDRVDLIGEDAYQTLQLIYEIQLNSDLKFIQSFAEKNNKLFALTECGYKNVPDSTWWTKVLKPIMDKYPICYFHTWRNYKEEYFAPDPKQKSAEDFKKLYEADNTLFLRDIL